MGNIVLFFFRLGVCKCNSSGMYALYVDDLDSEYPGFVWYVGISVLFILAATRFACLVRQEEEREDTLQGNLCLDVDTAMRSNSHANRYKPLTHGRKS